MSVTQMPEERRFSECCEHGCNALPAYRFILPDEPEAGICAVHAAGLAKVFQTEGGHLHLVPLHDHEIETPWDDPTAQEGDSDAQVSEGDEAG